MNVAFYARVSTHDQHTLPLQLDVMHTSAEKRGWTIVCQVQEIRSGSTERPQRQAVLQAARRREVDADPGLKVRSLGTVSGRSG
jgi:DNA invertase Pin-like site-specific DNA recombinase